MDDATLDAPRQSTAQIATSLRRATLKICLIALLLLVEPCMNGSLALGQESQAAECPPEGSLIALLTTHALSEGRKAEWREYTSYKLELAQVTATQFSDYLVIEKAIAAATGFVKRMNEKGHDFTIQDLIIHEETDLTSTLSLSYITKPIYRAQVELQLAVIRELKLVFCR